MNRQFGVLSGLAILLIVVNHAIVMSLTPPQDSGILPITGWERDVLSFIQTLGIVAVPIFLFISGSFIAYVARGDPPKLSVKFLITSLKNILLPYVIWAIIFYAMIYFLYGQNFTFFGYIKNLLVGYPFHFIPLLVFYYVISPALVRLGKKHGLLLILVILFYQLLLLNIVKPGILGFKLPEGASYLSPPVLRNTMSEWAVFFPLGLVYGLHTKILNPIINKLRWFIAFIFLSFFILELLNGIFKIINFPIARYISMVAFILIIPAIKRDSFPFVRQLEKIGSKSYGIYLTHLLLINISVLILQSLALWLYKIPFVLPMILFVLGISLSLGLMEFTTKTPTKRIYRYVFG
jgi:surface polysaccharide O-acyltransferase-like enzyme